MAFVTRAPAPRKARSGQTREDSGERPGLSAGAERRLVLAAKGDMEGRSQLIATYQPLIATVARHYKGSAGLDRLELMQEGTVGLLRALQRYDVALGTPFWAYASWWVRQAMQQLVSERTRPVVLSDRALRKLVRVKNAQHGYVQVHGKEPSTGDLAEITGFTKAQVQELVATDRKPRPLEEPVNDGSGGPFSEQLTDPCAEDEYEQAARHMDVDKLHDMLRNLSGRERAILRARYGLDGEEQTLRELGGNLGVSAERVRQIEKQALDKLRAAAAPIAA
jgi:RNA polymerase primary sigma factor